MFFDIKNKLIFSGLIVLAVIIVGVGVTRMMTGSKYNVQSPYFPEKSEAAGSFTDDQNREKDKQEILAKTQDATPQPVVAAEQPSGQDAISEAVDGYKIDPNQAKPIDNQPIIDGFAIDLPADLDPEKIRTIPKNVRELLKLDTITDDQLVEYLFGNQAQEQGKTYVHEELIEELLKRMDTMDPFESAELGMILRKSAGETDAERIADVIRAGGFPEDSLLVLIEMVGKLKDRRVFQTLYKEINHSASVAVRDAVIRALGYLGDDRAIPVLLDVINLSGRSAVELNGPDSQPLAIASLARLAAKSTRAKSALEGGLDSLVGKRILSYVNKALIELNNPPDVERADTTVIPGQKKQEMIYKGHKYLLYVPTRRKDDLRRIRVLLCVHGRDLDYESSFENCREVAKKFNFAVVAPYFDIVNYPNYGGLNLPGPRPDKLVFEILEHLQKYAGLDPREIYLYGEELGGEFVQAFTLVYPERVGRAMFRGFKAIEPDIRDPFPRGLGVTPLAPEIKINVMKYIKSDIALMVYKGSAGKTQRPAIKVIKDYIRIAEDKGVTPRISIRESEQSIIVDEQVPQVTQQMLEKYLFEGL